MPNKLRLSGIVFASVFAAGFILNAFVFLSRRSPPLMIIASPTQLLLLASIALFLLSAFVEKLNWIQPAVFLLSSPFTIIDDPRSIYGLGFFIMGVLLLERAGFFKKRRLVKSISVLAYLILIEALSVIRSGTEPKTAVSVIFFILAFGAFLWLLYRDRIIVIMHEPKPLLSLEESGLTIPERTYVRQTLKGKSQKEIAVEFELSESTVRNTLSNAYRKLSVEDRVGLAVLGERFELVD
jgi:DNA-binding CsgD family transcriptional regulator